MRYDPNEYDVRFTKVANRVERFLITIIVTSAIVLFMGQSLYTFDTFRQILVETEKWEGKPQTP